MNSVGRLAGKNILIVENEWLIADDLCRVLASESARVLGPAASVSQAFAVMDETPRIDAAVLDIHLGNGADAYPIAEALRRRGVPFVFTSGFDQHGIRADFAGTPYLTKPFAPSAIGPLLAAAASRFHPSFGPVR